MSAILKQANDRILEEVTVDVMYQPDLEQWGSYIKDTRSPIPSSDPNPCPMFRMISESLDTELEAVGEYDPDRCEIVHDKILELPEILQRVLFAYYCEYNSLDQAYKNMPCKTLKRKRSRLEKKMRVNRLSQREFTRHLNYAQGLISGMLADL